MSDRPRVLVVGGGAAGFFAAINLAHICPEAKITILEGGNEPLAKVRISGGGRCNLAHACWEPKELIRNYPRGSRELLGPFHSFCSGDTIEWFESRGVPTKIEEDGRMFPQSDSSQSIIDCLMGEIKRLNIQLELSTRVSEIHPPTAENEAWTLKIKDREDRLADRLMLATGSSPQVWKLLKKIGLNIVPPVPSLFTFNIKDQRLQGLPGISMPNAEVRIVGTRLQDSGPLLITHWGLSGPAVLKLSAWGARELNELAYDFEIRVDWTGRGREQVKEEIQKAKKELAKAFVRKKRILGFPGRLWERMLITIGIPEERRWADLRKAEAENLLKELSDAAYRVKGKSTFKEEFVTAGGVDLKEINFKTFGAKRYPGLYMAGEVLNIDAITGGFNFQAAWTGGWMAAQAMATSLQPLL